MLTCTGLIDGRGVFRRVLWLFFVVAVSSRPCSVQAQTVASTAPSDYDHAVELGLREFELGNYAEARACFFEAHRLAPNARTHRALGMAEFELKNYGDAIEHLQQALSLQVRPLDAQARAETEELLHQAHGYVGRVRLDVKPQQASVMIDGATVHPTPGGTLVLALGSHLLEFSASGRVSEKRRLNIRGGERQQVTVVLAPLAEPSPAQRSDARPLYKNPLLWTAVGVVVVGGVVGTAIALRSREPEERTISGSPEVNGGLVQTLWGAR